MRRRSSLSRVYSQGRVGRSIHARGCEVYVGSLGFWNVSVDGTQELMRNLPVPESKSVTSKRSFKSSIHGTKLERWMPFL